MAPRARFELATLRLTAERIENLSALSGVACEKLGAIFPSLVAPTPAPTRHLQNRVYCLCGNHADFAGRTIQFEINSPRSLTTTTLQFPVVVAVGTTIADRPPRRSVRARLRIRLLPWMNGGETCYLPHTVQSLGHALPALCRTHV